MTEESGRPLDVRSMFIGMLTMLVLVGLVWGVARLAGRGDRQQAAAPQIGKASVIEIDPDTIQWGESQPASPITLVDLVDLGQARTEGSGAARGKKAEDLKAAQTPKDVEDLTSAEDLTPEQLEEKRRQKKEEHEEMRQKEIAFMEDSFDDMKPRLMAIVDAYLEKPVDERPEYLGAAMKEYYTYYFQQRKAAGLTSMPRTAKDDWFQIANERMSDDEKERLRTFTNDIMEMQMAKMRAMMETRLETSAPPAKGEDADDIRMR